MIILALVISAVALALSLLLAKRVLELEQRLTQLPSRNIQPTPLPTNEPSPLEGLRVAVQIRQDYNLPIVENLLKEVLQKEDADLSGEPELVIAGEVTCNGYAEIYYTAEISVTHQGQALCNLIERPPHGDRPANLALELISRVKAELAKTADRRDRRQAINELNSP